jgi:hypothetical protein
MAARRRCGQRDGPRSAGHAAFGVRRLSLGRKARAVVRGMWVAKSASLIFPSAAGIGKRCCRTVDGGEAYVSRRVRLTRTAMWTPISARPPPAQRRPMRMVRPVPLVPAARGRLRRRLGGRPGRAGEAKRTERALCNR